MGTASVGGLQDPVLDQGIDEFGLDGTVSTQLAQGERLLLVDQLDRWRRFVVVVHRLKIPPLRPAG